MKKKIDILDGKMLHDWYSDLQKSHEGCWHLRFAWDDNYVYSVCMGWTTGDDKAVIACKIGRQTHNNCMQCDLDIDFEMPYNEETDDVDDTWREVSAEEDWDTLAKELRSDARRIWKTYKGRGGCMMDHYPRSK